jgi:hypothetical protein
MERYVNWVEAEWAGDFPSRETALNEAVLVADSRQADVIVVDELNGEEWLVSVCVVSPSPGGSRHSH